MFKPDVMAILVYDASKDEYQLFSNIRDEALEEVISSYVHSQIGTGGGDEPRIDRHVYTIKIGLQIADDAFACEHDCGNEGLALGIIVHSIPKLPSLKNRPLSEHAASKTVESDRVAACTETVQEIKLQPSEPEKS